MSLTHNHLTVIYIILLYVIYIIYYTHIFFAGEQTTLPPLSSAQLMKLKHLSIISLAAKCRVRTGAGEARVVGGGGGGGIGGGGVMKYVMEMISVHHKW